MRPALFWTIATCMAGLTTAALLIPLFWNRLANVAPGKRRIWAALAMTAVLPILALGGYAIFGSPQLLDNVPLTPREADLPGQHNVGAMPVGSNGGDLAEAVQRLKTRLAANPQDAAGWQLLAQSYEFAGDSANANDARAKAEQVAAGKTVAAPRTDASAELTAAGGADMPSSLAERAEMFRRKRDFPQSLAAFAELARTRNMTADLWADYADAQGAALGRLDSVSAGYISKALALDPRHVKALWLLASYQTEKSDYRAALITWEKLAKLMPADSSDYRIISANMDEARSKLTGPQTMAAPPLSAAVLRGTVDIDAKFKGRVAPGATLFVFAKEAGAGGPPLAVIRTTVTAWPMSFSLDDSQAMIPTRTLSNFSKVVVEARISRSGNAQAGAGDLHVLSKIVDPHAPNKLQLVIRDEIT